MVFTLTFVLCGERNEEGLRAEEGHSCYSHAGLDHVLVVAAVQSVPSVALSLFYKLGTESQRVTVRSDLVMSRRGRVGTEAPASSAHRLLEGMRGPVPDSGPRRGLSPQLTMGQERVPGEPREDTSWDGRLQQTLKPAP